MATRIIITGGTIDKLDDLKSGELTFGTTHVPDMLRRARVANDITLEELMMIDSLDMTDTDRDLVTDACVNADETDIVITHGTDTMAETARAISKAKNDAIEEKTIVLTGAMIPYGFGGNSDALFNLGTALSHAESLPPGVYISMNGTYFSADNVRKDKEKGIFTSNATRSQSN